MNAVLDLSLYFVTDQRLAPAEMRETVRAAVDGGVTVVQLRDHVRSDAAVHRVAVDLLDVLSGTGVPLVINDRVDVALAAGAAGVHLGQDDLPPGRVRELAGSRFVIGRTTSTRAELTAANALPAGTVDYVGLSPVYATPTKSDAATPLGLDGLQVLRAATALPSVAIGGIHASNAAEVMATGVDGVAVVSALSAAVDPRAAAVELRREVTL